MKKLLLLIMLICFVTALAAAQGTDYLLLDPLRNRVTTVENGKINDTLKVSDRPEELLKLANGNYALLCAGSETIFGQPKTNACIVVFDNNFKATGQKFDLPGNIVKKIYDNTNAKWYFITRDKDVNSALVAIDFNANTSKTVALPSPAIAELLQEQNLYIACFGNPSTELSAELVSVDLNTMQTVSYPLPAAPGAVFATGKDTLAIACGGIDVDSTEISGSGAPKKGYFNSIAGFLGFETADSDTSTTKTKIKPEKAGIFYLNLATKQTQKFDLGVAPLTILQSEKNPKTFYATAANTSSNGEILAWAYKLEDTKLTKLADLKAIPLNAAFTAEENIVCYDKDDLFVINSVNGTITYAVNYGTAIQCFALSADKKVAYVANNNSNLLDIIDLLSGKRIKQLSLGRGSLFGSGIPELFAGGFSSVIAPQQQTSDVLPNATAVQRFCFNNDKSLLYALSNGTEVVTVNTADNSIKNIVKFRGVPYGLSTTNDGKKIILATQSNWYLIDPNQPKPLCQIRISDGDKSEGDALAPKSGFLSTNGKYLLIPYTNSIHRIDLQSNKELKKIHCNIDSPIIVFP